MSAWLAHLLTPQTFHRSEQKAFEPNLCRTSKSVLLEHPALSGLQRVSLPKVLPGMPPELGNTRKSPRKQSAQCKLLFEERGRKPLLLAGGANLSVCGEPGAPCAPGELYRTGQCHARTVKGWWVWLAK